MKAKPLDLLEGPSNTTFTFCIFPNLPNSLSKSFSVVVKFNPNTPRQLVGCGFSLSPPIFVGRGNDRDLERGDLDLGDPDRDLLDLE